MMWKRWVILAVVVLLGMGGVGVYLIHYLATKTSLGVALSGDMVSSSTLVDDLASSDRDLVMTSLGILQDRNDSSGQQQARQLLGSTDDYIWFNAALYLGAISDRQAVPYLIKGLKHPASRAYPVVVKELGALTGQNLGMDQAKWIQWWNQQNPKSTFSFAYADLDKQTAEIQTGSHIMINRVMDPVTLSYMGSPIRLIGVRPKAGINAVRAQQVLETAMMYQFAEIERDGSSLTPDGAVPALVYWGPDPVNAPSQAAAMRQGLPAVPFTQRTNLQGYLLKSGFYELDLSAVQDAGIRAKLQALAPATMPAALGSGAAKAP